MGVEYNRSPNASREWVLVGEGGFSGLGKRWAEIRCPFCGTISRAFVWSLPGGGKCCENGRCGAKHGSTGQTIPRVGREGMVPGGR